MIAGVWSAVALEGASCVYLLGVDVGTTHCKAALYDPSGRRLTGASVPTCTITEGLPRGWAEYSPDSLWESVVTCIRETIGAAENATGAPVASRVAGVAVASMGEAGVLVDGKGNALGPVIAWFDERTWPEVEAWRSRVDGADYFRRTGATFHPKFGLYKLKWWKNHHPEIIDRAAAWLCISDYVTARLSGAFATDYTQACRTGLFNIVACAWDEALIAEAGLRRSLFPEAVCSGTSVGTVLPAAARETGLPVGVPVAAGGHDHVCGAFSAGVVEPGMLLNSKGTAEAAFVSMSACPTAKLAPDASFAIGLHAAPGRYYCMGGVGAGGGSVEWYMRRAGISEYAALQKELDRVKGPTDLLFLPRLRHVAGGHPADRAAFLGLSAGHERSEMLRAVLEGVAMELRALVERLEAVAGRVHTVRAIGGGTRNDHALAVTAEVLGLPVEVPEDPEASVRGAALLASVGAGVYGSHGEALAKADEAHKRIEPDPDHVRYYDFVYREVFTGLAERLRPVTQRLAEARPGPQPSGRR